MQSRAYLAYTALIAITAACATTGSTYQSGVAPTSFDKPPFYTGATVSSQRGFAHLPIRYQRGAEQNAGFEPAGDRGSPVAALIADMNVFLDSLAKSAKLSPAAAEVGVAPDVHFGCEVDAAGDCIDEGEVGTANRRLSLSVGRPSEQWISWIGSALDDSAHDGALVITLELGQYWPRQKGLSLSKEIQLASGYVVSVPWLTSLEKPVAVVQLTGALVGRDGRAMRIGAEGLLAKRSNIAVSALGAQALVSDDDIDRLRTHRRDDLPGQPLVWQAALQTLVSELTGR